MWLDFRHLTKLFDSMAHLKFNMDADGRLEKNAQGMFAKDGEYVEFNYESDCSGPVCILYE
jgi:dynein heavy chain